MTKNSEFAHQFGIPPMPSLSELKLDGTYKRSLVEIAPEYHAGDFSQLDAQGMIPVIGSDIDGVIVFADMGNFTLRSKELAPSQVAYWVNRFYRHAWPILERHHATLDKVIGDCLMLIFASDLGCSTPLESAVRACVEILQVDHWANEPHFGICKGPMFVGFSGPPICNSLTVFGGSVNLASRLAGAGPGRNLSLQRSDWSDVKDSIDLDSTRFEVLEGSNALKNFEDVEYVEIRQKSRWIPLGPVVDLNQSEPTESETPKKSKAIDGLKKKEKKKKKNKINNKKKRLKPR